MTVTYDTVVFKKAKNHESNQVSIVSIYIADTTNAHKTIYFLMQDYDVMYLYWSR